MTISSGSKIYGTELSPEGITKIMRRIPYLQGEVWTQDYPDTKQDCHTVDINVRFKYV
jgi:hypothetical protein